MRRALLAAALAAALAQWPGFGADFIVHVVDEGRKPVPQAFVVAREFVNVPQFHGSRTYCESADLAAAREAHVVRLPSAALSHVTPGRTHAQEAYAYAPGFCVERTTPARAAAYSLAGPAMGMPRPEPVKPASDVWLRATGDEGNEDRLQYLVGFAQSLWCMQWSDRSHGEVAKLALAMQAEADAIARTRYGKLLAQRLRERLAAARELRTPVDDTPRIASASIQQPYARDFILAPANAAVRFPKEGEPNQLVAMAMRPGMEASLAIHCRHGAPSSCDLDERDAQGYTALYSSVGRLDVEAVKLLLEAGANPSVAVNVEGVDSIDALLRRAIMNPPAAGSIDAGKALAIMDLLAASPKASIRAGLAGELASDPSRWFVKAPESLALLMQARARLAALPKRPDALRSCQPVEAGERGFEAMPVRLKLP